ncbi:MAG: hypothetical protein ACYCU8_01070 [Ferrimicrobium acidiphilum]
MTSIFVMLLEVVLIILGFNFTYDIAILFHGYNIAGNTAQLAANAGSTQVSSYQAFGGNNVYVGSYAIQQANAQITGPNISGSCQPVNANSAVACTVTYRVQLPTVFGVSITVNPKQTVVSKPVAQ